MKEDQASFVEKWAEADPAVRLLLLFAPRDRVEGVGLWLALLRELEDAAFNRSDVEISAAKLGFYARAFADGAESAHPLVRGWRERAAKDFGQRLVEAAHQLLDFAAASSSEALGEALWPWAEAAADAADILFGERLAREPIAADLLSRRLAALTAEARRGRLWLPLDLLAAEGLAREQLLANAESLTPSLARARARLALWWAERIEPRGGAVGRVFAALVELRCRVLATRAASASWPALRALWLAWRAARRARKMSGSG